MKYDRFEDLPVWQLSAQLAVSIFEWVSGSGVRRKGDLINQLQRATLSISNNIAEGFERGSTAELVKFLYFARGSAGEVRSMLCVMERMPTYANVAQQITDFKLQCESIGRQIRAWADHLQNTDIKGQRYLNQQSKAKYQRQQVAQEFQRRRREYFKEKEEELRRAFLEKAALTGAENEFASRDLVTTGDQNASQASSPATDSRTANATNSANESGDPNHNS